MHSNIVLLILILSAFISCTSSVDESLCDDVHLECPNKPFHDSLGDDSFSLLAEETLSIHCSDIIEDIECKRKYLSMCDPDGFEAFALATDGIKDVLIELCNETTELRRAYRTHSSCFVNCSDEYENCILNTVDVSNNFDEYALEEDDITSHNATIQRMCRFYEPFKDCMTKATRRYCGDSAAQLMEQIIVRAANPVVSVKCTSQEKK